jgi:hypothetical protein
MIYVGISWQVSEPVPTTIVDWSFVSTCLSVQLPVSSYQVFHSVLKSDQSVTSALVDDTKVPIQVSLIRHTEHLAHVHSIDRGIQGAYLP